MLKIFIFSILAVVLSLIVINGSRAVNGRVVTVLCAPSLAGPMEELKRLFVQCIASGGTFAGEDTIAVEITYRGSAELLPLYQISGLGDVLVAADVFYHDAFESEDLCDDPVLLGQQIPCLIYTDLSEHDALSTLAGTTAIGNNDQISDGDHLGTANTITTSIPKMEHAAIGRQVASIVGQGNYQRIASNAKVTRETVSQVAADVSNQFVDAGIAWTTTAKQFSNLNTVIPSGWEAHHSTVGASVMSACRHRDAALRFRDFLASPTGQEVFARYGFERPRSLKRVLKNATKTKNRHAAAIAGIENLAVSDRDD